VATPEIPGYQLLQQIGAGGMAKVYLAVQVSLDRKVAIKVLRTSGDDDPERTEKRFLREGRTLAKITHKNVCGIFDIAKVGDIAYIAMEYLDGGTLVDKLKHGVAVGESIAIVVQVASALEEAHKLGIIHRDLKPANVMLRGGRVPVLTDFGIARELTASQTRITAENMIVGTPIYMSPEQVSGGEVDGRSDLYSLGIMFFELLTGEPPYKGDTPIAVCMQHLTAALPKLPAELADLQPVMDRLLAKKREDRFSDMSAFTRALRDVFVTSEAMRKVAIFSPDTPWSEQLRELGFSFDTLRDADVKAALEAQRRRGSGRATAASPQRRSPDLQSSAASTAAAGRRSWPRFAALALALALVATAGAWWLLRPQPPTATELLALTQLRSDFTGLIAEGKLFDPAEGSALHAARRMREIHATAAETVAAFETLRQAAVARARVELSRRDLIALDVSLGAIGAGLPDTPELAELTQARAALATELAGEAAMRARIARLKALLDGAAPDVGESVLGLYLEMRPALADDPEFKSLEPRVIGAARVSIEAALASGDSAGALNNARRLAQALPQDQDLARLVVRLQAELSSADLKRADQAWRQTLAAGPIDATRLAALLGGLEELAQLQQPTAEHQQMRQLLATVVRSDADALVEKGDYDGALALLGQARAGLGNVGLLLEAQQRISAEREKAGAQQRLADERALQGQVAISSAPWARIDEIVDAAGKRVALPADAATPLLLSLPEGSYRVTLSSGQGAARRQEGITVERGKLATLSLTLPGYGAEQHLRELGW
jgi:serine/threonine protein kinase